MKKPLQHIPFFVRLFNWEYWPFNVVYVPMFAYYCLLVIRARSPLFFTAANPGIPTGGLIGESKEHILKLVPSEWKPRGLLIKGGTDATHVVEQLNREGFSFPLIVKPDVGERGLLVKKVNNDKELRACISTDAADFLVQEYIDYPLEVSVLHYRFPGKQTGTVSSLTLKEYLSVTGDGRSTLEELIKAYPRALLQLERLRTSGMDLSKMPQKGENVCLSTIGNHSKGCRFIDGTAQITPKLERTFDRINDRLEGIYYGRYDIKCRSLEDLEEGRHFSILEINGVKSEPTHIYDSTYPIGRFYRDVFADWKLIFRISQINHKAGVPYMSVSEAWARLKAVLQYHRGLQSIG